MHSSLTETRCPVSRGDQLETGDRLLSSEFFVNSDPGSSPATITAISESDATLIGAKNKNRFHTVELMSCKLELPPKTSSLESSDT